MQVFMIYDTDPEGGHYAVQRVEPDFKDFRAVVQEVREVEMPDELFLKILLAEIPVDEDGTIDSILEPYFEQGERVWKRPKKRAWQTLRNSLQSYLYKEEDNNNV